MSVAVDITPLVAAAVVIGGGAIAYWNQKRLDQIVSLRELRRVTYQQFVEVMVKTTSSDFRETKDRDVVFMEFQQISAKMAVVASDIVMISLARFQNDRGGNTANLSESSIQLLDAMRRDVFEGTTLPIETIKDAFPIKFGENK